jgi:hypothetical protein
MLGETTIPTAKELFVGDLAAVGYWVVANVQSSVPWPLQVETVEFRGHRIFLAPRSTATVVADGSILTMYPFAAVKLPAGGGFEYGRRLLSHFLSSLSWVEGAGITVEHWSAGSRAHPMGIGNHAFRATGISAYLKNGGTLEKAAAMANHASTRTTQLYDRRPDDVSFDEVERVAI